MTTNWSVRRWNFTHEILNLLSVVLSDPVHATAVLRILMTTLNRFPESASVGVVSVAAHLPHDNEQCGHDQGEGGREGEVLDLDLAGKLGELVGDERAEDLKGHWCLNLLSINCSTLQA